MMIPDQINKLTEDFTNKIKEFIKENGYDIAPVGSTSTSTRWKRGEFRAQTKEIAYIITIKPVKSNM